MSLARLASNSDEVSISVNNRGGVIPPEKMASIFDPIVRIATHATQKMEQDYMECTSLGIGLYIAREIIHAHSGQIKLPSTAGNGTTFIVTMPRLPTGFRPSDDAFDLKVR